MNQALTWLWKDYPEPIKTHPENYQGENLIKEQTGWQELETNIRNISKITCNSKGELFFLSGSQPGIYRLSLNGSIDHIPGININSDLSFDAHNRLIITDGEETKIATLNGIEMQILYPKIKSKVLEATSAGFYFSEEGKSRIGYFDFGSEKSTFYETPGEVSGMTLNAEQTFLNVVFKDEIFGFSYKTGSDKSLSDEQAYIHYHLPYGEKTANPNAAVIDTSNFLFTATNMGVQVSDQIGKVHMILPTPNKMVTDLTWGGKDFNALYIVSGGKIYYRRLNTKGKLSSDKPSKPGRPKL